MNSFVGQSWSDCFERIILYIVHEERIFTFFLIESLHESRREDEVIIEIPSSHSWSLYGHAAELSRPSRTVRPLCPKEASDEQ